METTSAGTTDISGLLTTNRVSRRGVLMGAARLAAGGTLAAALGHTGLAGVAAQGTPTGALPYPELKVTIVDDPQTGQAFKVATTTIPAGYVLITAVNQSKDGSSVGLIGPGPGKTMQDLMNEAATPEPNNQGFPSFFIHATLPGGPATVAPGETAQAIVQLAAGDWGLWGGSESSNPPPVFINATGGGAAQPEPPASVTITEVDFAFGGLGAAIPAGKQTWKVVNAGTQPHMLSLSQVPAGTTLEQVLAAVSSPPNATPAAGALTQSDFHDVGGIILQSPGATAWTLLDLPKGRYSATCFMTDPRNGEPHAMEGMIAVFDAGSMATPAA